MLAATSNPSSLATCKKREGLPVAFRFPAPNPALSILRPAVIPASVNLYDSAHFDMAAISGPTRDDLVDGLLTLNSLGVVSDDALSLIADGSLTDMMMWSRVEGGFSDFAAKCKMPDGNFVSPLVAGAFPLKAVGRSMLDWHDLRPALVIASTIDDLCLLPTLSAETHASEASEALAQRLPALLHRNQERIADHLNALMQSPGNHEANNLPLRFLANPLDAANAPLIIGGGDMLALKFMLKTSDFEPAYWAAVVSAFRLIGAFLRPMMTPEDAAEVCPIMMEEEEDDLLNVLAELKVRGQEADNVEAVEAILNEIDPYFIDCHYGFQEALGGYELNQDLKKRWLSDRAWVSLADFPGQVASLPVATNYLERNLLEWLTSVVQELPPSERDSAMVCVRDLAECEGIIDTMLPVFFDDDTAFADAVIQPVYEMLMSDSEESFWQLGWDIPADMLERFATGIRVGNELLIDLDNRISC